MIIKLTGTDYVVDSLPIEADKPTVQSERRARAKRSAKTTNRSQEKQEKRRIAESSDANSDDTADETSTPITKAGSKSETKTATENDPTATESDPRGGEDTVERFPEVSRNDEMPPCRSTRARKAVTNLSGVMIRWIQENEKTK